MQLTDSPCWVSVHCRAFLLSSGRKRIAFPFAKTVLVNVFAVHLWIQLLWPGIQKTAEHLDPGGASALALSRQCYIWPWSETGLGVRRGFKYWKLRNLSTWSIGQAAFLTIAEFLMSHFKCLASFLDLSRINLSKVTQGKGNWLYVSWAAAQLLMREATPTVSVEYFWCYCCSSFPT